MTTTSVESSDSDSAKSPKRRQKKKEFGEFITGISMYILKIVNTCDLKDIVVYK